MPSNQPDGTSARRERGSGGGARRSKGPRGRSPDNFDNFIIDKIPPKLPARLKLYVNPPQLRRCSPAAPPTYTSRPLQRI